MKLSLCFAYLFLSYHAGAMDQASVQAPKRKHGDAQHEAGPPAKKLRLSYEENMRFFDEKYEELSNNNFMKHHKGYIRYKKSMASLEPIPDVEMDQVYFTSGEFIGVGTSGLDTCLALGARGKNIKGDYVLAMTHLSPVQENSLEWVFENLISAFEKKQCSVDSIEFFVIGGNVETISMQNKILELSTDFNIVGAYFNPLDLPLEDASDRTVSVILTASKLFYGEKLLFDKAPEDSYKSYHVSEIDTIQDMAIEMAIGSSEIPKPEVRTDEQ